VPVEHHSAFKQGDESFISFWLIRQQCGMHGACGGQ